jgi:hypothetical protein
VGDAIIMTLARVAAAALRRSFPLSIPKIALTTARGATGDLAICSGACDARSKAVVDWSTRRSIV